MIEATLTRYDEATDEETELEVEAEYDFQPGCRGSRDRFGVPLEPDEPPMVEVHSVKLAATGEEIDLTEEEYEELERAAWADHEARVEDAMMAKYEARSERLYGYSVGKSTFGSESEAPIFVTTEDGVDNLPVDQFPRAERAKA